MPETSREISLKIRDVTKKKQKDELKNKTNKTKRDSEATGGKRAECFNKEVWWQDWREFLSRTVGQQPGWHEFVQVDR